MAGIRLEWAQFGDFDSFDVIRSDAPMDINALPSPIATNLPTMYHVDTTVIEGATYYYRVVAWRDGVSKMSGEIQVKASGGDEFIDNVVSLLNFESDLTDFKGSIWTQTSPQVVNNGVIVNGINTAVKTSDVLLSDTDKFTIEAYITFNTFPSTGGFWQRSVFYGKTIDIGSGEFGVFFESDGRVALDLRAIGASSYTSTNAKEIVAGQRVHIAHTYDGTTHIVFVDGVKFIEVNFIKGFNSNTSAQPLQLGCLYVPIYHQYASWIDGVFNAFRITKGVVRYAENFTPPDAPFPSY
jgi:hypothetical protein